MHAHARGRTRDPIQAFLEEIIKTYRICRVVFCLLSLHLDESTYKHADSHNDSVSSIGHGVQRGSGEDC